MMIGGWLYPLHLAISRHWKIHYVTADMTEDAEHRAEEGKFLRDMPTCWARMPWPRWAISRRRWDWTTRGIDFGLNESGEVLLFEANATMTVVPPGRERRWDYRRAAVQRVEDAVRKMLTDKARESRAMAAELEKTQTSEPTIYWQPVEDWRPGNAHTA